MKECLFGYLLQKYNFIFILQTNQERFFSAIEKSGQNKAGDNGNPRLSLFFVVCERFALFQTFHVFVNHVQFSWNLDALRTVGLALPTL